MRDHHTIAQSKQHGFNHPSQTDLGPNAPMPQCSFDLMALQKFYIYWAKRRMNPASLTLLTSLIDVRVVHDHFIVAKQQNSVMTISV